MRCFLRLISPPLRMMNLHFHGRRRRAMPWINWRHAALLQGKLGNANLISVQSMRIVQVRIWMLNVFLNMLDATPIWKLFKTSWMDHIREKCFSGYRDWTHYLGMWCSTVLNFWTTWSRASHQLCSKLDIHTTLCGDGGIGCTAMQLEGKNGQTWWSSTSPQNRTDRPCWRPVWSTSTKAPPTELTQVFIFLVWHTLTNKNLEFHMVCFPTNGHALKRHGCNCHPQTSNLSKVHMDARTKRTEVTHAISTKPRIGHCTWCTLYIGLLSTHRQCQKLLFQKLLVDALYKPWNYWCLTICITISSESDVPNSGKGKRFQKKNKCLKVCDDQTSLHCLIEKTRLYKIMCFPSGFEMLPCLHPSTAQRSYLYFYRLLRAPSINE